jgi:ribosome-associated translation inhibitor RaiA
MNIDWTFRGGTLEDGVQERIDQQLGKLNRFLRDPADAHVVVAFNGANHQLVDLEVVLTSPDGTFTGRHEGGDVIDVAREVLRRVEAQAQKSHDKRREGRRQGGAPDEQV